jgi:hypothetical protein
VEQKVLRKSHLKVSLTQNNLNVQFTNNYPLFCNEVRKSGAKI